MAYQRVQKSSSWSPQPVKKSKSPQWTVAPVGSKPLSPSLQKQEMPAYTPLNTDWVHALLRNDSEHHSIQAQTDTSEVSSLRVLPEGVSHFLQRQLVPEETLKPPRSLEVSLDIETLSKAELQEEIRLLRDWLAAHPENNQENDYLQQQLEFFEEKLKSTRPEKSALEENTASVSDNQAKTPLGAVAVNEIQENLDNIGISSRQDSSGILEPNFLDLNKIAPKNPSSKRDAFVPLQRSIKEQRKLAARLAKVKTQLTQKLTENKKKSLDKQKASLEKQLANKQKEVERNADQLKQWVKNHGLKFNTEFDKLKEDLAAAEKTLVKLEKNSTPDQATLTATRERINQLKKRQEAFQAQVDGFQPLIPMQERNFYTITVGSTQVYLQDYVVTYATDTPKGLEGGALAGDSRSIVNQQLDDSDLSQDKKDILKIVSEHEGTFGKMNTWDRAKITYGFIQWTAGQGGDGTLIDLLKQIKKQAPEAYQEYFQNYGIDVEGQLLKLTQPDGKVLKGSAAAAAIQTNPKLVAVLSASGADPRIQLVQIKYAEATKINGMRNAGVSVKGKTVKVGSQQAGLSKKESKALKQDFKEQTLKLGDIVSSDYGVGVMADRAVHTGEGGTRAAAAKAILRLLKKNPEADLTDSSWAEQAETAVVNALVAIDKKRARSFNSLSKKHGSFSP